MYIKFIYLEPKFIFIFNQMSDENKKCYQNTEAKVEKVLIIFKQCYNIKKIGFIWRAFILSLKNEKKNKQNKTKTW